MAFWKKWTQEVWFGPRESDDDEDAGPVQQQQQQQQQPQKKKKKKSKPKKQETETNQVEPTCTKPTWKDYMLLDRRLRAVYVVILLMIIGLILPMVISYYLGEYRADLGNCNTPTLYRFECLSGSSKKALTRADCERADCCWDSGSGTPKCYHKNPTRYTYTVTDVVENSENKMVVDLRPERRQTDMFGNSMPSTVRVVVRAVNRHHLIVQLLPSGRSENSFRLMTSDERTPFDQSDFQVSVSMEKKKSFGIVVKRTGTGEVLLDTSYGPLAISDEYVEMSTTVPSEYIYGLGHGERRPNFKRNFNYGKTALYNRPGADSYHPFFMAVSPVSGNFHGVFWDNPYPLEVQFSPVPAVSFRSMGGTGIFHVFAGPTPAAVSQQFTRDIVGLFPPMPPFWSLGFHLCREHDNSSVFTETVQQMTDSRIGFDSDCIDQRLSGPGAGSVDSVRFPQALEHRDWLRDLGKKFVLAQPPHVLHIEQFPDNQWILHNRTSEDYEPGNRSGSVVYYPSYPSSSRLNWDAMFQPEGFTLLDNWPSNEGNNSNSNCDDQIKSFIPDLLRSGISNNTVCLDAYHPSRDAEHLAVHNHYGVQQLEYYLNQFDPNRFLYMSRASALGNLGRAGYPGDDLTATWTSMKMALVQVLEMGLFGVPMAGAPICGSVDSSENTEANLIDAEQLCSRWYQMGLLLPFAHSTSKLKQRLRSPVDWSLNARRIISGYIQKRYTLLPYFYTLFYQASQEGTPVVRPLWYEFPLDNETYPLSGQFMIGQSIMVAPVMIQSEETESSVPIAIYFPRGTWYDYYSGEWLSTRSKGESANVSTGLYHVNMYVVNGSVFVTQDPASSAEQTRSNPYTVTVAFPISSSLVHGWLYVDDGSTGDQSAHDLIRFVFTHDTFTMQLEHHAMNQPDAEGSSAPPVSTVVDTVRILGLDLKASQIPPGADYDIYTKVLQFQNLNFDWSTSDTYSFEFIVKNAVL